MQRDLGPLAAFIYAATAIAMFCVALLWIGPAAIADSKKLIELAVTNPTPLIVQDVLKLIMAVSFIGILYALFKRLHGGQPAIIRVATFFGLLSTLCLVINAGLSLFALSQTTEVSGSGRLKIAGVVAILGFGALLLTGIWYLLVNWSALKQRQLPRWLCYLGISIGVMNLIPVFALLALIGSIVWSVTLGKELRTNVR